MGRWWSGALVGSAGRVAQSGCPGVPGLARVPSPLAAPVVGLWSRCVVVYIKCRGLICWGGDARVARGQARLEPARTSCPGAARGSLSSAPTQSMVSWRDNGARLTVRSGAIKYPRIATPAPIPCQESQEKRVIKENSEGSDFQGTRRHSVLPATRGQREHAVAFHVDVWAQPRGVD